MTTPTSASPAPLVPASGNTPAALTALLGADAVATPWWRRRAVWIGVALLAAAGAGFLWWQNRQVAQAAPRYVTEPVTRGNLAITVTANGTLQPTRQVSIGSELSGTIKRVHVDVNDPVRAGQVLIELDTSKLDDQLTRSRAALASAQSGVLQAEATAAEQRSTLARLEEVARLSGGKVPSKAELDTGRAGVARANAALAMARSSVADARAAVRLDETSLSKASIRSPINGVVLTRTAEPGNAVAASLQAVTLLTLAEDLRQLKLQVKVDEADVGMVKAGQTAQFTVSAWPARTWPATIRRVAFGSTITDNVVTYPTDLQVANDDLSLRPGMTATATIAATEHRGVLMVPNAALRFTPGVAAGAAASSGSLVSKLMPRPPGNNVPKRAGNSATREGSQRQIWILQGQQATPLTVTTGLSNGRMTEVTGAGLSAGQAVIVSQASAAP
ncbi:efflux RND transporter periplasmic adaptor subunit [uncultured Sphaerotilus sp.]|uniref:efflux RND transporter periplasmic adaptor subunit n=1 Tax=uncultured Sphaerotilus sp. TaxID=474984 RepID=UPI0030CA16C8